MQLFKAKTIQQFKIHQWLVEQGLQPEAFVSVEFPAHNQVRITDFDDEWALFTLKDGFVSEEYSCWDYAR